MYSEGVRTWVYSSHCSMCRTVYESRTPIGNSGFAPPAKLLQIQLNRCGCWDAIKKPTRLCMEPSVMENGNMNQQDSTDLHRESEALATRHWRPRSSAAVV